jgi:outer membrane biosynthesis protein TonB
VIVGLIVIAWLVLAGLPFGGEKRVVATETSETIAEGTANVPPEPTGTVVDLGTDERFATQTIEAPPLTQSTQTTSTQTIPTQPTPIRTVPPVTQTQPAIQPPPVIVEDQPVPREAIPAPPRPIPRPAPRQAPEPEPAQEETRDEISEAEASSALRSQLASANPYDGVSQSCLQLRSLGYRNVGYTFAVWDACVEGGGARMLGRWRVDAKTREVFRQGDDGRYH